MKQHISFSVGLGADKLWDGAQVEEALDDLIETTREKIENYADRMEKVSVSSVRAFQVIGKSLSKTFSAVQLKKTQQQAQKQTGSLAGSLRRSLMDFDQINRLNKKTGAAASAMQKDITDLSTRLSQALHDMFPSLESNDPIIRILEKLGLISKQTQSNIQDMNIYGSYWDLLGNKMQAWCAQAGQSDSTFRQFINTLLQGTQQADSALERFCIVGGNLREAMQQAWQSMQNTWGGCGNWFESQVTAPTEKTFQGFWSRLRQDISGTYEHTKLLFSQVGKTLSESLSKAWTQVYGNLGENGSLKIDLENGVLKGLKSSLNAIIRGLNTVVAEPFSALNSILEKVQKVKVGKLTPFSFLNWRVSIPTIPQLAQGAVLPANKPFLAMVGDQRHGTNIEAPLSTIQEAVALTMEDMSAGNMAGHAATVEVLRDILQAVLGISISDSTIANACARHQSNMAVVLGK